LGDQIKKNEMGGAGSMCGAKEKGIQGVGEETYGKKTPGKT
jgi:hypothetical protein